MKRFISLFLVVAICFSLGACGKVDIEEAVIGDWTYDLIWKGLSSRDSDNPELCLEEGHSATNTLSFYKGGTFKLKTLSHETGYESTSLNGTWEIVDGVVVISTKTLWESSSFSLAIDTESKPYTLTMLDSGIVYVKTTGK